MGFARVWLAAAMAAAALVAEVGAFGCGSGLMWRGAPQSAPRATGALSSPLRGRGLAPGSKGEIAGPTMGLGGIILMQMRDPLEGEEEEGVAGDKMSNVDLLEAQLATALAKEDYGEAAALRDRLSEIRMDSTLGLLECNSRFYRAFSSGNYREMDKVWHDESDFVSCGHPGTPLVSGRDQVMESWRNILANPPDLRIENPKVAMYGPNTACVTCEEHLFSSSKASMGPTAVCLATNIFVKKEGDEHWRIAHHHAGPIIPQEMRIERNA